MSIEIKQWCQCEECEGSGRTVLHLKGAGILTTESCWRCWGFGRVFRSMTKSEKRAMAQKILQETA